MNKFTQGNTKASRLTGVQVMEIRDKYANRLHTGITQEDLSREYQVSITTIRNVVHGVTWQRLAGSQPEEQVELQARQSEQLFKELEALTTIAPVAGASASDALDLYMKRAKREPNQTGDSPGNPAELQPEAQADEQLRDGAATGEAVSAAGDKGGSK